MGAAMTFNAIAGRKLTNRIETVKDKFLSKRCFIIGNGPSINKTPISKLEGQFTFSFNRAFLAYEDWGFIPSFYACIDLVVLPDNKLQINEMISATAFQNTLFFFPGWAAKHINESENVFFIETFQSGVAFEENLSKLALLRNVGATSIQIAIHLGFKEIILVGCDASYIERPNGVVVDPEESKKVGYTVYKSMQDNDPNHFLPNYFGKGTSYSIPNLKGHLKGWQAVSEWVTCYNKLNGQSIRIVDATVDGKLDCFQKIDLDRVLAQNTIELDFINKGKSTQLNRREIIVFGAGQDTRRFIAELHEGVRVKFFIDDDESKWGNTLFGRPIYPPEKLGEINRSETLVISDCKAETDIRRFIKAKTGPKPIEFGELINKQKIRRQGE
jgi:6-hydroxymethylpterin diphosphokinase MptE-like